jgi:hypothetical protein
VRNPLEFIALLSFEPKRSSLSKPQKKNVLARATKNRKRSVQYEVIQLKLMAISTVEGAG